MNEMTKTGIFAGAAVVALLAGALSVPRNVRLADEGDLAVELCPELTSAESAAGLRIVQTEEASGEKQEFRVSQQQGRWVLPSHNNYPADAKDQVKNAATALVGLKPLAVATGQNSDHAAFGVVSPDDEASERGSKGVGTLVEIFDSKDQKLGALIIGKKVAKFPDQRFVRRPKLPHVYTAKVSLEKFSAKFEDWIEKDLLQLKSNDIDRVKVKDYVPEFHETEQGMARAVDKRMELDVKWDDKEYKWQLENMLVYRNRRAVPVKLLANEELNTDRLNELKTALGELKIVDVQPKPKGLAASLRVDADALKNSEWASQLLQLGFGALKTDILGRQHLELVSANGDVVAQTKDGVEYTLRFGNIAGAEKGSTKLNRYLFVVAALNEAAFPKPELKPVPELPAGPAVEPAAEKKEPAADAGKTEAEKQADAAKPAPPAIDTTERDRTIKENERLVNEWKDKRQKAEIKVADLNARFADWYYVVSEDVFKKIRVGQPDVIREKTGATDEGFHIDSFRKLEEEGLKKKKEASTGNFPGERGA